MNCILCGGAVKSIAYCDPCAEQRRAMLSAAYDERDALKAKCDRFEKALVLLDSGDRDAIVAAYPQLEGHFMVRYETPAGPRWQYKNSADEINAMETIVDRALRPEIVEEEKP